MKKDKKYKQRLKDQNNLFKIMKKYIKSILSHMLIERV